MKRKTFVKIGLISSIIASIGLIGTSSSYLIYQNQKNIENNQFVLTSNNQSSKNENNKSKNYISNTTIILIVFSVIFFSMILFCIISWIIIVKKKKVNVSDFDIDNPNNM